MSSVEYVFDDTCEFDCWLFLIQQVAYELWIRKCQKRSKCLLIRFRCAFVAMLEVGEQQIIELTHSSSALPP